MTPETLPFLWKEKGSHSSPVSPMRILQDDVYEVPTPCQMCTVALSIIRGGFLVLPWSSGGVLVSWFELTCCEGIWGESYDFWAD